MSLLPKLAPWKKDGLYLAGGTALALQLGHRTSLDFDFYSEHDFEPLRQIEKLDLPPGKIKLTTQTRGTLLGLAGGVQISAFYYPYQLLKPPQDTPFLALASLQDIAAMKVLAIAQRGKRRDFVDLYFLCREFSLSEILKFAARKYPSFDIYTGLRGLLFFDDADQEKPRLGVRPKKQAAWETVKQFFLKSAQIHLKSSR